MKPKLLSRGRLELSDDSVTGDSILPHTRRCPQRKRDDDEYAAVPLVLLSHTVSLSPASDSSTLSAGLHAERGTRMPIIRDAVMVGNALRYCSKTRSHYPKIEDRLSNERLRSLTDKCLAHERRGLKHKQCNKQQCTQFKDTDSKHTH